MEHDLTTWGDLTWQGWFVLAVVAVAFVVMIADLCSPPLTMLAEMTIFMVTGIITARQAFAGFSSTGVWIVAIMLAVAQGLAGTGGLNYIMGFVLGKPTDVTIAQIRILLATMVLSSFISGTPVTAMMLPIACAFAQKARLPLKQLLEPMVFASQTAGTNTLLGTSSNMAVVGQMELHWANPQSEHFRPDFVVPDVFALSKYGIPGSMFYLGIAILLAPLFIAQGEGIKKWFNYFLLSQVGNVWQKARTVDVELVVAKGSYVVGMSVDESGMLDYNNIVPISLTRADGTAEEGFGESAVLPGSVVLQAGDRITFAGDLTKLQELVLRYNLSIAENKFSQSVAIEVSGDDMTGTPASFSDSISSSYEDAALSKGGKDIEGAPTGGSIVNHGPPRLFVAKVAADSTFIGQSVGSINFPDNYKMNVIAVTRNKAHLNEPVHSIILSADDEILFDVAPTFWLYDGTIVRELNDVSKMNSTATMKEFVVGMEVRGKLAKPLLVGKTVSDAGLKALTGGFLIGLQRGPHFYNAIDDEERLQLGDIAWFVCTSQCLAVIRTIPGLLPLAREYNLMGKDPLLDRCLMEATISPLSPILGKSAEESGFTKAHHAVVLGIYRQGKRVIGYPSSIPLQAGDTLLIEGGDTTLKKAEDSPLFTTVMPISNTTPPKVLQVLVALGIYIPCFLLFAVWSWRPTIVMMATALALMICTRCLSPRQAWKAVHWDIIMCIGASMAVSEAMDRTGAAEAIAASLLSLGGGSEGVMLAIVYVTTSIMSNLVMDTAAAMMIFPVAASIADVAGIDIYSMSFAIMIGANACYVMPFGSASIMMTFAMGGYRTPEWMRFSIPIQILMNVNTSIILIFSTIGLLKIPWIYCSIFVAACVAVPHVYMLVSMKSQRAKKQRREAARKARLEQAELYDPDVGAKGAHGYSKIAS